MNIIFVPNRGGRYNTYRFGSKFLLLTAVVGVFMISGFISAGYYLGRFQAGQEAGPAVILSTFKKELFDQRQEVDEARRTASDNMDALALRLGRLQSHVIRLDALGERLTKMANLDKGEFDFSTEPAQGGPENEGGEESASVDMVGFTAKLDTLTQQMDNRAQQLALLETMLMNRGLQKEVVPAGRPVTSGWLSSYFGIRTDPFTGRNEHHYGLDFAGKLGSDVVAVASGVVTWAGKRYGYGNLVEINHGNGYSTRYGHNEKVNVKVGDAVKKGQIIAKMGSTGRSTGPHVHFEVLHYGKAVDPMGYIRTSR